MKKMRMIPWILGLLMVFGYFGMAFGGGGPEDAGCANLPEPNKGPLIWGYFTVARDQGLCTFDEDVITAMGDKCQHYNVHLMLTCLWPVGDMKWQLFSFPTASLPSDLSLVEESTILDPTYGFRQTPCSLKVGQAFGIDGIPVIKKVRILRTENGGQLNEMMLGTIMIRVVPVP